MPGGTDLPVEPQCLAERFLVLLQAGQFFPDERLVGHRARLVDETEGGLELFGGVSGPTAGPQDAGAGEPCPTFEDARLLGPRHIHRLIG